MARPKEELDLPNGWDAELIALYSEGASDVEIKAWIYTARGSFSNDLWDRWMKEEQVFSETIKRGKVLSEAWWSKKGRISLEKKDFNFVGWYMNMKNRFGWRDKQEIDHTVKDWDISLSVNDRKDKLHATLGAGVSTENLGFNGPEHHNGSSH